MPETEIGNAVSYIKLVIVLLGCSFGVINALSLLILAWIKKSIDSLWSKRNQDHERIIKLEAKINNE
jgi:predicted outer membrane lipoprotein